jgi:hypothetical protein
VVDHTGEPKPESRSTPGVPDRSALDTSACAHVETTDALEAAALVPSRDADLLLQCPQITKAKERHVANGPVWLPQLTTRCPLRFDCLPGETSRLSRGKLACMSDVTQILSAIEQGDPHAAEQLLPLVYDELRRLAAGKLAQERPGQTLQATALPAPRRRGRTTAALRRAPSLLRRRR